MALLCFPIWLVVIGGGLHLNCNWDRCCPRSQRSVIDKTGTSGDVPYCTSGKTFTLINCSSWIFSFSRRMQFSPLSLQLCKMPQLLFKCLMNWHSFLSCRCQVLYPSWQWQTRISVLSLLLPVSLASAQGDGSLSSRASVKICGLRRPAAAGVVGEWSCACALPPYQMRTGSEAQQ